MSSRRGVNLLLALFIGLAPASSEPPYEVTTTSGQVLAADMQYCGTLYTMPPPAFDKYMACTAAAIEEADLGIPGIVPHLQAGCWCDAQLQEVVRGLGCCSHSDFAEACKVECEPNCSSPEAQLCRQECPAICFEAQYAPESCVIPCATRQCNRFLRCVTSDAVNESAAGEGASMCHEREFTHSAEVKDYLKCQVKHSHRSAWQAHNAAQHCNCESRLGNASRRSNCCEAAWGRSVCEDDRCEVPCDIPEARECADRCESICGKAFEKPSLLCQLECFDPAGNCSAFAHCPPRKPPTFNYVCDDGSPPQATGCCNSTGDGLARCPLTCESQQSYRVVVSSSPGIYTARATRGSECFCGNCPSSLAETQERLRRIARYEVDASGEALLAQMTREAGLVYPSQEMLRLMIERNELIAETLQGDLAPLERERRIREINSEYLLKIKRASQSPTRETTSGEGQDDPVVLLGVIVCLGAAVCALACVLVVLLIGRRRLKKQLSVAQCPVGQLQADAEALAGMNDQLSVVVGRPVGPHGSLKQGGVWLANPREQDGDAISHPAHPAHPAEDDSPAPAVTVATTSFRRGGSQPRTDPWLLS
eukprot:CAMPEP_0170610110 /NCGR_PEP_ID=MMETSP0224-20130122/22479_1 /TAXON_ID=285029 /ORGANISM="Togula jolla, Strain CCCM 725" /LENGTH=593 /DNA_ID=CAMNT_0010935453 /DNA_START=74 /DNA_END=1855 /DNA_ORIENTATION=-